MMIKPTAATVLCLLGTTLVHADIVVEWAAPPSGAFVDQTNVSGYSIVDQVARTVTLERTFGTYRVYTRDSMGAIGTENVDVITVPQTGTGMRLYISDEGDNDSIPSENVALLNPGVNDWNGLSGVGVGNVTVVASLNGSLTGDVDAKRVARLDAGVDGTGDIIGNITSIDGNSSSTLWWVRAADELSGNVVAEGDATTSLGDVRAEKLTGSVTSDGTIFRVYVTSDIGGWTHSTGLPPSATGSPVEITALKDNSPSQGTNIGYLLGTNANVDVIASVDTSHGGRLGRFRLAEGLQPNGTIPSETIDEEFIEAADSSFFAGTVTAFAVGELTTGDYTSPGINVVNSGGDIELQNRPFRVAAIGNVLSSSTISIGGRLRNVPKPGEESLGQANFTDPGLWITSDTESLAGQVIINSDWNTSLDPEDYWEGPVFFGKVDGDSNPNTPDVPVRVIGPSEAQPNKAPRYNATAADLGGGHIGLPPFYWHPVESGLVMSGSSVTRADLVFYGFIHERDSSDSIPPVIVERTSQNLRFFQDCTGCDCAGRVTWTGFTAFTTNITGRTLQVIPDGGYFPAGYRYRIRFERDPEEVSGAETDLACVGVADGSIGVRGDYNPGSDDTWPTAACESNFFFAIFTSVSMRADLNSNGWVDSGDALVWANTPIDFNEDGFADSEDLQVILNHFGPVE